ncbi:MAG: peptide ABC transporter substrate-binding protein [Candidatus Synoicihabitans palmerolidicus]|nr:peptide ABC transporter substrate-binding protein [Candidatus Synoicihabitans palmerolidicus]
MRLRPLPHQKRGPLQRRLIPDFVGVGIKVIDDTTLTIETTQPTPGLPAILSLPVAFPVPLHLLRRTGGTTDRANHWTRPGVLVGNGPFNLTDWSPHQHIRGKRNPRFRTAPDVSLHGIVFYPYPNIAAQETACRVGQLHLTSNVPLTKIKAYREPNPELLRLDPFLQTAFIRFNTTRAPFDDIRVRRALALSIDRRALSAHVLTGGQQPATALTPPGTLGFTAQIDLTFDPDLARQLLTDAGFPDGQGFPSTEIQTRPREIDQQVLQAIQQMWHRELGIDITIALKEQRVWLDDERRQNYALSNAAWVGDFIDPYTFLGLFTSDSGYNATGWQNPRYDALLATAHQASTEAERFAAYQAAESPITPLYYTAPTPSSIG